MSARTYSPVEMIERLVSFDTTSRDPNLPLIHFVADYLKEHGVDSEIISDETGAKANLYATIGPRDRAGVILSGHTDVVPVDGQNWSTDPFRVEARDDRLYGRGTADMKSFLAIALALAPEFLSAQLKSPVHLALSYDEEVGCIGVHGIVRHIQHLSKSGPLPRAVIVGEPTEMKVVNAHKGVFALDTTVSGLEAHSSATHLGVNAVSYAAELVTYLQSLAEEMKTRVHPDGRFEPPYSTVHVGTIQGGTARNIIPKECTFQWEVRAVPESGEDLEVFERFMAHVEEKVLPRMREQFSAASITTQTMARVVPFQADTESPAENLAKALSGGNQSFAVSYGTEAGVFQEGGVPTVVCGPGNILQAHKPDEYIAMEQVEACVGFMRRLMSHLKEN